MTKEKISANITCFDYSPDAFNIDRPITDAHMKVLRVVSLSGRVSSCCRCLILACLDLYCLVVFCPVLSCLVLSCLVSSCLALP
jgi:hypothetical protein